MIHKIREPTANNKEIRSIKYYWMKNENSMELKAIDTNEIQYFDNKKAADWLRSFKGCEHYTDEEAAKIVQSLERLANILFDFTCEQNGILIDNQLVITSNSEKNELKTAA